MYAEENRGTCVVFFMELFVKLSWDPRSVIIILFVMHGHVFTSSEVQPRILMQYV